jgi:hypothetical protein
MEIPLRCGKYLDIGRRKNLTGRWIIETENSTQRHSVLTPKTENDIWSANCFRNGERQED